MMKQSKIYGKELILDLYDCDLTTLCSKEKILEYLNKVCQLIGVKKYGKPLIARFGEKSHFGLGYSFFQFIEESSISGHFIEQNQKAFLNIFSCKPFNDKIVKDFTKNFFRAKTINNLVLIR